MVISVPNMLTWARIILIPLFVASFYFPSKWANIASAIIFCLAGVTDWLDGYLARKLNQITPFGAFLDPVADKLLVTTALVMLVGQYASAYLVIPSAIIIGREIAISALREWMAEVGKRKKVAVGYIGKLKTASQMIAIVILLSQPPHFELPLVWAGFALLYAAVVLTLWSMFSYIRAAVLEVAT
jgi:CDP-diacylglycerol--glycerol-3-phosphate 3-phosphatidyltransferase